MKHTRGPWTVSNLDKKLVDITGDDGRNIISSLYASGYDDDYNDNEDKANAILIAAAPEMLEALVELTEVLKLFGGIPSEDPFKYDKLIKKAKGL